MIFHLTRIYFKCYNYGMKLLANRFNNYRMRIDEQIMENIAFTPRVEILDRIRMSDGAILTPIYLVGVMRDLFDDTANG